MSTRPRSGRRPGNPDTREAILRAATDLFAANGFSGTSMRQVGASAGVDPALIHHYFTSKNQLFLETVQVSVDIGARIGAVLAGGPENAGRALVTQFLSVWDGPDGPAMIAAFRAALADPKTTELVREFIAEAVLGTLMSALHLAPDDAPVRAGLIASQMVGIVVGRYLLAVPPLATMPAEILIGNVGATVQRYLTEPLTPAAGRPAG